MRLNSNFNLFTSTNFSPTKYIPSPSNGVNRFLLDRIGTEQARATTIVQFAPHCTFPKHTHIGGEEFVVLEGTFCDEYGSFPKGTYVRNPIGSAHAPYVEGDGCVIMVKLLQMADDVGEGTAPLYVHFDDERKESTEYGSALNMYCNDQTGERVQMCWVQPNTLFPVDDYAVIGGEELFVIQGSLQLGGGGEGEDENDEYVKWGWLRFPPLTTPPPPPLHHNKLKAGKNGAQIYRKTGHLTSKALSMEKMQLATLEE